MVWDCARPLRGGGLLCVREGEECAAVGCRLASAADKKGVVRCTGSCSKKEDELTFVKVGCSSWCLSRISLPSLSPSFADSSPPPTTLNFFFKHGENAYPPAFHPPHCRRTATALGTRNRTAACAESSRTCACKIEQGRRCRGEGGAVVCFISLQPQRDDANQTLSPGLDCGA